MCAAGNADRGFTWSDEETAALLKFWGAKDAQNDSAGNKRNYVVYDKISEKMRNLGFNRSTSQCREKIKRMKREYTLTKQFNGTTSGPKKLMRFYDQFERILLEKQSENQRTASLRAGEFAQTSTAESQAAIFKHKDAAGAGCTDMFPLDCSMPSSSWASGVGDCCSIQDEEILRHEDKFDKDETDPWAPAVVLIEGDDAHSSSFHGSPSNASATASYSGDQPPQKKKKVVSNMTMFQNMMDSITNKFIEYQEAADARFLAQMESLEQERRASEENIQKMWMEFEEKRRRDEQDHELQIISTFRDILSQASTEKVSKPSKKT